MLKKRDLTECGALFELMRDPEVFPFVRQKANTPEEYLFITKQTIELEEQHKLISRTIIDEYGQPIGTITLFDVEDGAGFLGTWLGKPYFGKGYNKQAKDLFFEEVFNETDIHTVFLRIREENIRSQKAALKLAFVQYANDTHSEILERANTNPNGHRYNLYAITKENFLNHKLMTNQLASFLDTEERLEA
ncbi:GNAT family N-acetyltransferase [Pullulanibacillus sp. KACC 23026]|uniref:GNAT family N-acetyltransferase n=1 Tax=Pullulanibacillus sp. KACC 23026 TaxID=3028315 RepID=UPI0023B0CA0B|nr:GNAT family N-acetyltransferase [Pullulanibacillus sp. KACC 23026]WEG12280.1 GNAT family N-acetyltransferase [Pullulanibacillus sp. KACC 23026]